MVLTCQGFRLDIRQLQSSRDMRQGNNLAVIALLDGVTGRIYVPRALMENKIGRNLDRTSVISM